MGAEQVDAVADALDVGQVVDLTTSLMSSVLSVLSDLFFLVTLLLFLAFDSAHVSRLADGVRRHRPHLVEAMSSFARGTRTYLGVSAVFGLIVAVIDTVATETNLAADSRAAAAQLTARLALTDEDYRDPRRAISRRLRGRLSAMGA